jgi:plastocyanin
MLAGRDTYISPREKHIMRILVTAAAIAAFGLCLSGCGAYGSPTGADSGSPTGPSGAIVIEVLGINGAQSFRPNPGSVPNGQMVVWHNIDTETHRVVLDDRSVDTGNLGPGSFSAPTVLGSVGPYHCTIHPEMVGTVTR